MKRRDKAVKTQHRKTLKRRNAPKAAGRRIPLSAGKDVAQFIRERDEALEQQTAMSEILGVISNSPTDLAPVFNAILANATRLCEGNLAALWLYDGKFLIGAAQYNASAAFVDKYMGIKMEPGRAGPARLAALERRTVHVADITAEPGFAPLVLQYERARSVLAVPLLRQRDLVGVIAIWRREVRPFTDKQIELLTSFAAQAVIAIENTRLLNELRESLQQQTATADVLKVISRSTFDLQTVLDTLVESAARLCEADMASVTRPRGANDAHYHVAHFGFSPEWFELMQTNPLQPGRKTLIGRTLLEGRTVHIPDVLADPEYSAPNQQLGAFRAALGVPMLRDGIAIGIFMIARRTPRPFTDKQIELATTFADQAAIAIENVRLFDEVQARTRELSELLEQQTATSEVLKVISGSPGELEPVFQTMLENATRICDAKFGTLFRYDGDVVHLAAQIGTPPALTEFQRKRGPFRSETAGTGVLGRVIRTKAVVHSADSAADPNPGVATTLGGARSIVGVPMSKDDALVGAIVIYRQEVRPFTDKQIELVQNFAAQAVIAIENTRLLNELRKSLQQQTATADVLKVISRSTFDLQTVLDTLVESAARLCGAEMANIWRPKDGAYHLTASYGVTARYKEYLENKEFLNTVAIEPGRGTMVGRVLLERKTVHMHDIQADPDYKLSGLVALGGYRTMLGVPMLRQGDPIGVLVLVQSAVRPFTDKQIELATTFADQAVIAIENVRLFDEVQARTRELSEALEQQTATSDVLSVISSSPGELEPVFSAMLENATRLCEARYGTMWLREGDAFRAASLHGPLPPAYSNLLRSGTLFRAGPDTPTGRVAQTRQPVQVLDLRETPPYLDRDPVVVAAVEVAGIRTMFSVPMLKEDQLVGTISIYRQEILPFTTKQIELVQNFAAQAVIAIENMRLLSELRESLQQQTATADVLKVISRSTFDLKLVLEALIESATKLCGAARGHILQFNGEFLVFAAAHNAWPGFREHLERHPFRPGPDTIAGRAAAEHRTVHVHDIFEEPELSDLVKELVKQQGYRTVLAVPMLRRETLLGVITILKSEVEPFTDKQVELVETFADQAVIAVENVRLLSELRESLQQQTATADVLKTISRSTFDLRTVLQTLVESAARFCAADKVTIIREKDGAFYRAEAYGFSREYLDYVKDLPIKAERGSAAGRALVEGRMVHIADVKADPKYTLVDVQRLGDYRTILSGPNASRKHRDRRTGVDPFGRASIHREADRASHDLCRPGRDCNRERAVV